MQPPASGPTSREPASPGAPIASPAFTIERPASAFGAETAASYAGYYINLDRSLERRTHIESELARHGRGQVYERFSAADGNAYKLPNQRLAPGEMGCFLSHLFLLQQKLTAGVHLHIVEDDVILSPFTVPAIAAAIRSGLIDRFDVVFTDSFVQPTPLDYPEHKRLFDSNIERDARGVVARVHPTIVNYQAGTASYIVNRASIAKLADVLVRSLASGAAIPLDLAIRKAAKERTLRVGCLFPFVSSVRIEETVNNTIGGRSGDDLSRLLPQIGRHSFFVDCNHRALCELTQGLLASAGARPEAACGVNPHQRLLDQIAAFCGSGSFVAH